MKTQIVFISLIIGLLAGLTSCEKVKEFENVSVTAVKELYEPVKDKCVVLQPSGNLYFEWGQAYAADNSIVFYELVFDKEDGDFSEPLYIVPSDGRGVSNGATITHKQLNKVAIMAGADSGEEVTLKWAVRSNRGLNFMLSDKSNTFSVVRMVTVDDLQPGEKLFIGGEGAEAGQQVREIKEGNIIHYEIYTKLEAGKPYYFYSLLNESKRTFAVSTDGTSLSETTETPEGTTVAQTGVYCIGLDFEDASVTMKRIDKLEIRVSWTSQKSQLSYIGQGVWQIKDYNVRLTETDWGFDERYKFEFTVDGAQQDWGQVGSADGRPTLEQTSYFDMAPTENGQWSGSQFKFAEELCDASNLNKYFTDITVYLTAEGKYRHDFTNIRD